MSLSCTVSKILSLISLNLKRSHVTLNTSLPGNMSCVHGLVLLCMNQHPKFEMPSFTNSKDMIGAKFLKNGHVTLTTPTMGVVCHPKTSTWYILPAHKIWRLSLEPFQKYDFGHRNLKWVMWQRSRPFLRWFAIHGQAFDTITYIYQIWSLYFHLLRRYERRRKISDMGWFGIVY